MLAHRDTHSLKEFDVPAGTVVVGVIKMNMGCELRLEDGHKRVLDAKGKPKSGKVQGRFTLLKAGYGSHVPVMRELIRMQNEDGVKLTQESVAKAAENIGYDGKPTYIFETNNLMLKGNIPEDLLAKIVEAEKAATGAASSAPITAATSSSSAAPPSAAAPPSDEVTADEPAAKRRKNARTGGKEDAEDPRVEWFKVVYPSYWQPPFKCFEKTRLTKLDWQYKMCVNLITSTVSPKHCAAFGYETLEVEQVHRVENPTLWADYYIKRQRIAGILEGKTPAIPYVKTKLASNMDESRNANEYYFFHGLNQQLADLILAEGLDERVSNLRGMFGCGIYFAEDSSKSDQYSHTRDCAQVGAVYGKGASKCTCASEGTKCMLICRVVLGHPQTLLAATAKDQPMRRPPVNPATERPFDAVLGESVANDPKAALQYREYVVFDRQQVYPEFIVYYHRKTA